MKKLASLCVAVLLLCTAAFAVPLYGSVTAAGSSLLQNGDFETPQTLSAYTIAGAKTAFSAGNLNGWFTGGNGNYGKDSAIVADGENNHALLMTGRAMQQIKGLKTGAVYSVRFKAKRAAAYSSATVNLRCRVLKTKLDAENSVYPTADKVGGSIYALYQTANGSAFFGLGNTYTEYSFTFTAGSDIAADDCLLLQFCDQTGKGAKRVMLDDVTVTEQGLTASAVAEAGGIATVSNPEPGLSEQVTFTATPGSSDYAFLGWFTQNGTAAVSTANPYTVTITEDLTLYARFTFVGKQDPTELLFDGKFDTTKSVALAEDYNTVTFQSAHIWYKPSGKTEVALEGANRYLTLQNWVYQSVAVQRQTSYVLRFRAKCSANATLKAYLRALKKRDVTVAVKEAALQVDGAWHDYTLVLNPGDLNKNYADYALGLEAQGAVIAVDDLSLKPKTNEDYAVSVSSFRCGSATVSKSLARPGEPVTFTALPQSGAKFLGWYLAGNMADGALSTELQFTTTVSGDTKLIAVFGGNGYPESFTEFVNSNFETGNLNGWRAGAADCKPQVQSAQKHGGNYALAFDFNEEENNRSYVGTNNAVLLPGGYRYTFSCYFKTSGQGLRVRPILYTELSYSEGRNDFVNLDANLHQDITITHQFGVGEDAYVMERYYSSIISTRSSENFAEPNADGWCYYSASFELLEEDDGTLIYFGLQGRLGSGTIYLDDLTVDATKLDRSTRQAGSAYCEWLYNSSSNGSFEQGLNKADYLQLAPGVAVLSGNAAEGSNALAVGKNAGATVIQLNPAKGYNYIAYSVLAGSSGSSYIGITEKEPTAETNFANPAESGIEAFSVTTATGWQRQSLCYFVRSANTPKYLVIYGGSNAFQLDYLQTYAEKHHYTEDPNLYKTLSYDYNGNGVTVDDYDRKYAAFIAEQNATENPQTGAKTALPCALVAGSALLLAAALFLTKRGKKV